MTLVRNLIILALILGLVLVALKLIFLPMIAWAFQLVITLTCLVVIGVAVIYLYRKLRT